MPDGLVYPILMCDEKIKTRKVTSKSLQSHINSIQKNQRHWFEIHIHHILADMRDARINMIRYDGYVSQTNVADSFG